MSNYQANARDQKRAESIRRQYVSREENKMEQLQKLDSKVKSPGKIIASIIGVIGALVMGYGMALVMVSGVMTTGIAVGVAGMVVALIAYPIYAGITNSRKKKYAAEVMRLSDDVIKKTEEA
ncbi:MAG TPA: hypothetical protein IAC39_04015 [Candidatus Faeciplasma pullistercoris]|uniref:Uncharacterized protein n=1 Tax=Candidatus Faeciplasma pullistercoris TaxID=2840800 RepID=A0A9D1GV54_9FIRM|nr:hypothetical protein [Candidatus Faeciplasma pullistercoris]